MILQSLYDYAKLLGDKLPSDGLEKKEILFAIVIDKNGQFIRFESQRIDKRNVKKFLVAKGVKRTSAPKPNTLWDNGKYVFGFEEKDKKCNDLFIKRVFEIANANPEDSSIVALRKFYEIPMDSHIERMTLDDNFEDVKNSLSANFSFKLEIDDKLISEMKHLFIEDAPSDDADIQMGRCLVTGKYGPIIRTATATPLPDNSPMAALVSFQIKSGYDSYGKTKAYNAPISVEADFAISSALKYLTDKNSKNKFRLGNRTFLFWGSGNNELNAEVEEALSFLLGISSNNDNEPDPDSQIGKVRKLFSSIYTGVIKTTFNDRFHILGLAPNTGRISVVLWMDSELSKFAEKIQLHLSDMEIIDNRKTNRKNYSGVFSMISAVTLGGKVSDATPNLIESLIESVINGTPYPYQLFTQALQRVRAELTDSSVSIQRAAILKAYINRATKHSKHQIQLQPMLDKTNSNQGYICGRLIAVLEKIQEDANSGNSIRSRYMGAASTTPSSVFPTILNLTIHHSEKLPEGTRIYYEQLKQQIIEQIPADGFPTHLNAIDQGRFFVGYYHQRADFFKKKEN